MTLTEAKLKRIAEWGKEGLGGVWSQEEEDIMWEFEDSIPLIITALQNLKEPDRGRELYP